MQKVEIMRTQESYCPLRGNIISDKLKTASLCQE